MKKVNVIELKLPIISLPDAVVFPKQEVIVDIVGKASMLAVQTGMSTCDQTLFLVAQKDPFSDHADYQDVYPIGCVAKVQQVIMAYEDRLRLQVKGLYRGEISEIVDGSLTTMAMVSHADDIPYPDDTTSRAMRRVAAQRFKKYLDVTERLEPTLLRKIQASTDCGEVADIIAQETDFAYAEKAIALCELNTFARLEEITSKLDLELQLAQMETDIRDKTMMRMDQSQKSYYIREKMQVMRNELGEEDDDNDIAQYEASIRALKLPEEMETKLLKELSRLKRQPFGSQEGAVLRNYLDIVLDLPWNTYTKERVDVEAAKKILERDHFGLEKVKERILETFAVRKMAPEMPPQIICLVGPPGVGKTSIAYSIAKCLNRKLARISLGGVHDEADIRGHRKTYVGAMPGRIISAITQAKSSNPLILMDEIDKMGSDYRGDPSAALLEVLDSEQNKTYRDHFLELPFDLSHVMFIATANSLDNVPRPLIDRMEVIELGSYTDEEKLMIAKNHLVGKQLEKHGIKKSQLRITDDAIREIIACYTRESGVRNLERSIEEICRKAAMQIIAMETPKKITVNVKNLTDFLGVRKFTPDKIYDNDEIGLVTGLAWTSVGGETLEVEVNVMEGTGKLELTGNLGDVMKESAHAAMSYIRSHAENLGVDRDFYKTKDIHVHFPEGAVPKDGPSAGVTVCTAIVSALTATPVKRDVAMTGEISIRGRVLPIGGLKEKTMAAFRHGVSTVIIPKANEKDLEEIDQMVRKNLKFVTAEKVETVLNNALTRSI